MSSFKGKFGYVQYHVKALMERPQLPTLECRKSFEVEEPLDVNTPDLLVRQQITAAQFHNKFLVMHHPLTQSLTWLHLLSLPQVA